MLIALYIIAALIAIVAAALFGILGTLTKTKSPVFNITMPTVEIPPITMPEWPKIEMPKVEVSVAPSQVVIPEWPKPDPIEVNVHIPEIKLPEFPKPEPVTVNNEVVVPEIKMPEWPAFPEQKNPYVVVRLVPSEVDVHPAVKLPVLKEGVTILKKTGEFVGTRDIDHPDVFEAQKDDALTIQWPDGQIGDIMPPNFRKQG